MKYKKNDILDYNSGIKNKHPQFNQEEMKLYFYYVIERFKIQIAKESHKPFPWTDNEILQTNSFTCNRRIDDKTSKWLLKNITNNRNLSIEDKFWKSLIFRAYNKIETAELLHLDIASYDDLYNKYSYYLDTTEYDVFTRAYKNIRIKYANRESYPEHTYKPAVLLNIINLAKRYNYKIPNECLNTAQDCFNWILNNIDGVGDFLGFQLLLDIMYINDIPYSNNCFVISGPGSQTGIDRLFSDKDNMSYEECIIYLTTFFDTLCKKYYDESFDYNIIKYTLGDLEAYCVTDIQNTLCEFSKFRYLMEGRHNKPRKYIYAGDK